MIWLLLSSYIVMCALVFAPLMAATIAAPASDGSTWTVTFELSGRAPPSRSPGSREPSGTDASPSTGSIGSQLVVPPLLDDDGPFRSAELQPNPGNATKIA